MSEEDNVVRLPREWLGPPEKLVPFGEDEPATTLVTPDSTHDFWGDGLGTDFGLRIEAEQDVHARGNQTGRRRRGHRSFVWPAFPRFGDVTRARRVSAPVLLAFAAILVIVALAVGQGRSPSHPARAAAVAAVRSGASAKTATGPVQGFAPRGKLTRRPAGSRTASARRAPRRGAVRGHRTGGARHRARVPRRAGSSQPSVAEPVHYTTPSYPTTTSSSSSTPPTSSQTSSPSAAATGASAGSHQPATGAAGALGPGSSPDG